MDTSYVGELLQKVREENPLIHNITNVVVTNFTANGLLALGASPVMAYAAEEVADMAKIAGALVLNIGTLNTIVVESMLIAGKSANANGVPVVLDPVGAGATAYRTETAQKILEQVEVSILRGNAAEIANTAGQQWNIKGVDAGESQTDPVHLAKTAAKKLNTVVVLTGKEDIVTDGEKTFIIQNGDATLTKVTGTGCLLTSVIGAFTAVESDRIKASVAALTYYGVAAEIAAKKTDGPGSFQIEFLNQLSTVTAKEIEQLGNFSQIKE